MFDHLTDDKRSRIHDDNCMRREELDAAQALKKMRRDARKATKAGGS